MCFESPLAIKRLLGGFQELWTQQDTAVTTHPHTETHKNTDTLFPYRSDSSPQSNLNHIILNSHIKLSCSTMEALPNPAIAWLSRPSLEKSQWHHFPLIPKA